MPTREMLLRIKAATVAIAEMPPSPVQGSREAPFSIVGTGFCIDPSGIVVTCEHVLSAFSSSNLRNEIAGLSPEDRVGTVPLRNVQIATPGVLFYADDTGGDKLMVYPATVIAAVAKTDYDLGAIRLGPHRAFPNGYPFLEIEDFATVHEGMEVATCGFPLGNVLHDQLGTKTSSYTRGILSSIAPTAGARIDLVTGFQLDLTATFGNSGGPVFGWESGKVLGVLQGGPITPEKTALPGIAHAEPVYRILRDGTLDRLRTIPAPRASTQ